jgi:hypothetical protein
VARTFKFSDTRKPACFSPKKAGAPVKKAIATSAIGQLKSHEKGDWFMRASIGAIILGTTITLTSATFVSAQTTWDQNHPRRAEVNGRLENQNSRIKQEVREGEISKSQAKQLHAEDHAIRQEERAMARTNNGHITGAEQKALNQQENQVSRQIGR